MRFNRTALLAVLPLALAACGSSEDGESADDFANRLGDGAGEVNDGAGQPVNPALANLPKPASDGKSALVKEGGYSQIAPDGSRSGLTINQDGSFELVEAGKTTRGEWEWLPDGKRLRLKGVDYRPVVLVANGAIYRMTNEGVPLNDLTPDRMYTAGTE